MQFLTGLPKTYQAEVVLGVATTTLDASGEETGRWDMTGVSLAHARRAASRLTGEIQQVPPMVSAVKVGGRRLHHLARQGVDIDRPARTVTVTRFDLAATDAPGVFAVEVECSSGTYVRTLAADLGVQLGGGAHLRRLRRTAVGPWTLGDAVPLDAAGPGRVIPPAAAMRGMAACKVGPDVAAAVGHGAVLDRDTFASPGEGPWAVLDEAGSLLAVYQAHRDGRAKPVVVLAG
jgi:tRNA pseudouridine55 synthase